MHHDSRPSRTQGVAPQSEDATMPQCRLCGYDGPGGAPRCPGCGAWLADQVDRSPGDGLADGSPTTDDFEFRLLQLLREGQKIAAIKLYREETGVGLKEAKDAVEALATRHGVTAPRAGCFGVLLLLGLLFCGPATAIHAPARDSSARKDKHMTAAELVAQRRVLVIAHRGDSAAFPENTLPAFESAAKLSADLVELDYHHSSDGAPIVIHDKDLDRTTDALARFGKKGVLVADKSAAELQSLDAGRWFHPRFAGTKLPTLAEALAVIQPRSTTLIERKAGDAATCVRILKDHDLLQRVVVQAFDWEYLADCRRLAPSLTLVALGKEKLTPNRLDQLAKIRPVGIGWSDKDTDQETISHAHRRGLKVWVYTVDDPHRARQLLSWKVDGLITNVPHSMQRVVADSSPQ